MPLYAVIGRHEANGCPMNSQAAREAASKAYPRLEELLKQKHAKLLSNLHLDPNHAAFMEFEAPSAEVVRDMLMEAGFAAFLDMNLYLVTPISEILKQIGNFPVIYP